MTQNDIDFILISIYFPPDSEIDILLIFLETKLKMIAENFSDWPIIIGGDFNCHVGQLNSFFPFLNNFR